MLAVSFEADIATIQSELPEWANHRLPSIIRNALNDTAEEARVAEIDKIRGIFDRPKPLTLRAPLYRMATKETLEAAVFIRDEVGGNGTPPARYLAPQIIGGARRAKGFELLLRSRGIMRPDEFAIPAIGQPRDAYGNLAPSVITRLLSQLGAGRDVGYMSNATPRSRARGRRRAVAQYFVPDTGARGERGISRLPRGVYQRMAGGRIRAVLIFVSGAPGYRKRYDFGQATIAKSSRVFGPYFERHFYAELAKYSARAMG
jgi:hypothetical protein